MLKRTAYNLKSFFMLIGSFAALMVFGQNCSPGLEKIKYNTLSSLSVNEGNRLAGEKLYSTSCAQCHGDLNTSTKLGKSPSQIMQGRTISLEMAEATKNLTVKDYIDIAAALSPTPSPGGGIYQCSDPNARGTTADRMRKLTLVQLKNTLRDLLGTTITNDNEFKLKLAAIPNDSLKVSIGEVTDHPSYHLPKALYEASLRAIVMMNGNTSLKSNILGTCAVSSPNEACARTIMQGFGKKVLRRPATTAEIDSYINFFTAMGGGAEGIDYVFARLMQNPSLVFHIEEGGTAPSNGRYRLNDYEIASRISYLTSDTMPDDALFAAADRGELQDLANVKSHVTRYALKADGINKVKDFFRFYTHLHDLTFHYWLAVSENIYVGGLDTAMKQEVYDFVNHIVYTQPGTFKDLMTSTAAFPKNAALAKILETTQITAQQPVSTAPNHPGLFHRPGLLASAGARTSPILRGAHIRRVILCDNLADPPANAVAARQSEIGDLNMLSNRDGTDLLTNSLSCSSCHSQINGLGYTFEKFNQFGARRTVEPIFNGQTILRTFPIDTSVNDPNIEAGGPTRLADSHELVFALAESKKAQACYSRRMFEYFNYRAVDPVKDGCALAETEKKTSSQDLKTVLIDSIANEDIFWRKQP